MFAELEEIISWFEQGENDLDEGLKRFERGLALAAICKKRLSETENKVIELKKKYEQSDEDIPAQTQEETALF